MREAAVDTEVIDEISIPSDRRRTKTMPPLATGHKVTLDLADPDVAADFLEAVAKLVRSRRRISIIVE